METPFLMVVTGPPAAGKTTVSRMVQVHCSAPLELLLERYGKRERHPGHVDSQRIHALREAVETGRHDPLALPGETIRLDTSEEIDLDGLARWVRDATRRRGNSESIVRPAND